MVEDQIEFDDALGGAGPILKILPLDLGGDGNVDICFARERLAILQWPAGLQQAARDTGLAVLDFAVLPGAGSAGDSILVTDGSLLSRVHQLPVPDLFPDVQIEPFSLQPSAPALVAVAGGAPTVRGWIVGGDGTQVTSFLWDGSSAAASGGFTAAAPVRAMCTLAATGGAEEHVALLTDLGVGVYDSSGFMLYGRSGQAEGSLIARLSVPGGTDCVVSVLEQAGSEQRRIHVDSIAGSDPSLNAGEYDFTALAAADVDCDGIEDLLLTRRGAKDLITVVSGDILDHSVKRFSNNPASCEMLYHAPNSTGEGTVAAFDLEGDGDEDVLCALEEPGDTVALHFLRGDQACAWSLDPVIQALTQLGCDPTGSLNETFTVTFTLDPAQVPPSANTLRVYRLTPNDDLDRLLPDEFEVQVFHNIQVSFPPQVVVEFPVVPGGSDKRGFVVMQYASASGGSVAGWPPLVQAIDKVFPDLQTLFTMGVWPSAACISPAVLQAVYSDCNYLGEETAGGSCDVPKPPPFCPPPGGC